MKKYLIIIIASLIGSFNAVSAETADALLKKAADAISAADGISASFTLISGGKKVTGTLKSDGNKFALLTSTSSTWYDGKTMWTYNASGNETTLMYPTSTELSEANPLYIVKTYSGSFTAQYAKTQEKGFSTVVLTPKSKRAGFQSVHVSIPDGSNYPAKIVVVPLSGQKITISISQIKTGQKFQPATFTYPKSKYPNAEIVDLR